MEKVLEVVIRGCPGSQVILLGLLPRGIPDPAGVSRWPSNFARGLLAVNALYEMAAAKCDLITVDHLHFKVATRGLLAGVCVARRVSDC